MRIKKSLFLIFLAVGLGLGIFQNCAPYNSQEQNSEDIQGLGSDVQSSGSESPVVWSPDSKDRWLRDPTLFKHTNNHIIMSGTRKHIVHYPGLDPKKLVKSQGSAHRIKIYSPNGQVLLRQKGFKEWGKKFFRTSDGQLRMLSSLPQVANFNNADISGRAPETLNRRSTYLFVPINQGGKNIPSTTFPLEWRMSSNKPFSQGVYNVAHFKDTNGRSYLYSDVRKDRNMKSTCILAQHFNTGSFKKSRYYFTLCPGKRVRSEVDFTGWDRNNPFPSEIRHDDGGGLLEGAWVYHEERDNLKVRTREYFILYSAGDYAKTYGGYVAVCQSPLTPCRKLLNEDKTDVRPFLKSENSEYYSTGRPHPVVNEKNELIDIIFHARKRSDNKDYILRCDNFSRSILKDFAKNKNHPGCIY